MATNIRGTAPPASSSTTSSTNGTLATKTTSSACSKAYALIASSCQPEFESVSPPERLIDSEGRECFAFLCQLKFPPTSDDPKELQFIEDLEAWSERWDTEPVVEIMVMLPELSFPHSSPPEIRLLRPLLIEESGGVVNGFFMGIPRLYPLGWNPHVGLPMILQWIRECLRSHTARVNRETNAFYNLQAFAATKKYICYSIPKASLRHPGKFTRKFTAYSGGFAEYIMQVPMKKDFHYGNKVLLHSATLEMLMRNEITDLAGSGGGDRRRIAASALIATGDDSSSTSESAMLFECTSALGFPVYVGVAEFTAPEPDMIILPHQIMRALGIDEGTQITVTRVILAPATTVVLQPHATNFHAVQEFTGQEPREFLEESLVLYSCLQAGSTIVCGGGNIDGGGSGGGGESGGSGNGDIVDESGFVILAGKGGGGSGGSSGSTGTGATSPSSSSTNEPIPVFGDDGSFSIAIPPNVFRFNVVSVSPESSNSAVALFAGFQSQVNIEFLPAMDEFSVKASPRSSSSGGSGAAVPIYQGPAITSSTPDDIAANSTSSSTTSSSSSGLFTGGGAGGSNSFQQPSVARVISSGSGRYAPIGQAAVLYDPAAAMIGGIMPDELTIPSMVPNMSSSSSSSSYSHQPTQGNTLGGRTLGGGGGVVPYSQTTISNTAFGVGAGAGAGSSGTTTSGGNNARGNNTNNNRLVFNPSPVGIPPESGVSMIPMIPSTTATTTTITIGSTIPASSTTTTAPATTTGASLQAEREARRKTQAEAAAKRLAAMQQAPAAPP